MHPQIKQVCATVQHHVAPKGVSFDLRAGEQTPLGKLLSILYYRTDVLDLVPFEHRIGFPHNGGMHTLYYNGPRGDAVAFLELWKEELEKFNLTEEQRQVASELSFISQEILSVR